MGERIKIIVVNGAVIICLCLLLFYSATWWSMHTQFALGEAALTRGDFTGAVAGYESAIHMYIPGNPAIEKAAQQLWRIGEANERLGDITRALIAYRSLRSSFYAVQWLKTPGTGWIARCDGKIASLIPLQRER
jgi:tetratricopeptide (TPR) repeat protein